MINCDNSDCASNTKGVCNADVVLEKTWQGSEKNWKLHCLTYVVKPESPMAAKE